MRFDEEEGDHDLDSSFAEVASRWVGAWEKAGRVSGRNSRCRGSPDGPAMKVGRVRWLWPEPTESLSMLTQSEPSAAATTEKNCIWSFAFIGVRFKFLITSVLPPLFF